VRPVISSENRLADQKTREIVWLSGGLGKTGGSGGSSSIVGVMVVAVEVVLQ